MKEDLSNGKNRPLTEGIAAKPETPRPAAGKQHFFFNGLIGLVHALRGKTYLSIRRKKVGKDGTVVETEIIYKDDC